MRVSARDASRLAQRLEVDGELDCVLAFTDGRGRVHWVERTVHIVRQAAVLDGLAIDADVVLPRVFDDDMEGGQGGWSHSGSADEWELGEPTYSDGPTGPHSGSSCWGTDLDGEYEDSADASLFTAPFEVREGSALTFRHWYLIEPFHDRGRVEITLDGDRTVVHLNGEKVNDYLEGSRVPVRQHDYEPVRGPRPREGYIGIQNHHEPEEVHYREVSVVRK